MKNAGIVVIAGYVCHHHVVVGHIVKRHCLGYSAEPQVYDDGNT